MTLLLSDEYRQVGDLDGALGVLTAGLEESPDHVATRVAKGRCHLDLDDAVAAQRELSRVAIGDPTHALANKLLVEVHARLGDEERARDRLGLFSLLVGDAGEVAALERRIQEGASGSPAATVQMSVETGDEPFELPDTPAAPQLTMDTSGPSYPGRPRPAAGVRIGEEAEPFVLESLLDLEPRGYFARLSSEGIFRLGAASAVGSSAALSPPVESITPSADSPTVTLGELYRKQGHNQEAADIFRQILDRQPGNTEAAKALVDLEKQGDWPLSAEDLLGGSGDPNAPRGGPSGSRDEVLKRYRERLRGQG